MSLSKRKIFPENECIQNGPVFHSQILPCHLLETIFPGHMTVRFDYVKNGENLKYALCSIYQIFHMSNMVPKHQFISDVS